MKQIVIVGGGTGGIMTAAKLVKEKDMAVTVIEPAEYHYYQPAWTLVGANTYNFEDTKKKMSEVMPAGVNWVKDYAEKLDPDNNKLITRSGEEIKYDYLVLSPGLVYDMSLIEGLEDAIDKGVVCSNYTDPKHTWDVLKNFKGGNAVFTQPTTPIKCGGAPQKIAYLAADYFRKSGIADKTNVIYATPGGVIFGIKEIKKTLEKVIDRYGIEFKPHYAPVKIDADKKIITFKFVNADASECVINKDNKIHEKMVGDTTIEMPFDMLHLAPPQVAPKFISESVLANEFGWLDVDINTLQHKKFANIFGMGDAAALPTAKTGAAIRKQVPVVIGNIKALIASGHITDKEYNGYSSCPLVTGYGKMVLAEFDYEGNFTPDPKLKQMLIFDSSKELTRLWWLKKYILPRLYWNKMLKGKDV
ncbi:NAD(P)/FAD-dependent oxidoreductase [Paracrocinitomix mangrovi]|uniref:NAD(P)/FAD-dependent oxidoreductase n=1 Tax=Paracrocinitomix mangrovi TaxID=2862509 RepID=UPI001C8D946A|nr:FAD/NAD(P)-binding oxidoreductase [Paracrocinitomix mangrovi]UKN01214.1 NAD(P)/FAD-dependent oxidoreductase [Paracrocinitomix mangrovi]